MQDEMDDGEFLNYCARMTETERCGFVPSQLARLLRLAGMEEAAARWDAVPNQVISADRHDVTGVVEKARDRVSGRAPSP